MAHEVFLYSTCRVCRGVGFHVRTLADGSTYEDECNNCGGDKLVKSVTIDGSTDTEAVIRGDFFDDVIAKLADLETKLADIKEVVDGL